MLPQIFALLPGGQELWLVLIIVVLLFGAAKIPELARSLGKAKSEYQKASREPERGAPGDAAASAAAAREEEERVRKAARDLGIPTDGRPLADVKADIQRKMNA